MEDRTDIVGTIELVEEETKIRTGKFILVGDFPVNVSGEKIKGKHTTVLNNLIDKRLSDAKSATRPNGYKLSDFSSNKMLYAVIKVPKAILDQYTG